MRTTIRLIFCAVLLAVLTLLPAPTSAQAPVIVRVAPATLNLTVNAVSDLAVEVVDVEGLYGFDVQLSFDPAVVEVVDADPNRPGVQVSLGRMLDPGMSVRDSADNVAGTIHYAMTQLNPSEAKSGTGNLIVIKLRAKAAGSTDLVISSVDLARRDATEIPSAAQSGVVVVTTGAATQPTNTPIPTQAPPTAVPTGPLPTAVVQPAGAETSTPPAATATAIPPTVTVAPATDTPSAAAAAPATDTPAPTASPTLVDAATPVATLATESAVVAAAPAATDTPAAAGAPVASGETSAAAASPVSTDPPQPTASPQAVAEAGAAASASKPAEDDNLDQTLLSIGIAAFLAALALGAVLAVVLVRRRRVGSQ